jgi:16S rRNA (uracil1498-N3)-methyltransferase
MAAPLFFSDDLSQQQFTLNEDTSKYMINVLRLQKGATVLVTDGKGKKATAVIEDDNRKKCRVKIISMQENTIIASSTSIAISLIKNTARFERFLEKATEIGIHEIIPMMCERTEKEKFRYERLQGILISAMLQSQQSFLPIMGEPVSFSKVVDLPFERKYIAHCLEDQKQSLKDIDSPTSTNRLILIGPEGDFTPGEIKMAVEKGFQPVTLGNSRLRTETAGVVAAVLLAIQ